MTLRSVAQAEDELRHVTQQFAQWRQRRITPRGRIPQSLWVQAVALTHVLPLARVAKQLGLCPQRLRKRGRQRRRRNRMDFCHLRERKPDPELMENTLSCKVS